MKVFRISFKQNNNSQTSPTNNRNEFLYYPKQKEKSKITPMTFVKVLCGIAMTAVGITLYNLKKNKIPMEIVDLAEKDLGLNKIDYKRTAKELKQKILYPIKTGRTHKNRNFNSGLILSDSEDKPLKEIIEALSEHAEKLGIMTNNLPDDLNKADRRKWIYNAIENAKEIYKKRKIYTIINIGNLDNLIDLKIVKPKKTTLEDRLIEINKNVYSGIVWTAWTNNTKSIPMYYNNLPVLVTKLVD